jgi:hypothetical protein
MLYLLDLMIMGDDWVGVVDLNNDDPFHWNDYKNKVIETKYQGTWKSQHYNFNGGNDAGYDVIVIHENWIEAYYLRDDGNITDKKYGQSGLYPFVFYTEGTTLYYKLRNDFNGSYVKAMFKSDTELINKSIETSGRTINFTKE